MNMDVEGFGRSVKKLLLSKRRSFMPSYKTPKSSPLKSLLFLALFIAIHSHCYAWSGKVTGISDGDTIEVLHNKTSEKIRLYGIDCPEKRQAFGKKAKQFTSRMVFKKTVDIKPVTRDRYGRTIAWVYFDGKCLNEELLKAGFAWHYKKYSSDQKLADLELSARQNKVGLWNDRHAIPPWEFRHGRRRGQSVHKNTQGLVYHGNYQSMKFHRPGCKYYNCSKCTVIFNSREEAIRAGYVPCKICKP